MIVLSNRFTFEDLHVGSSLDRIGSLFSVTVYDDDCRFQFALSPEEAMKVIGAGSASVVVHEAGPCVLNHLDFANGEIQISGDAVNAEVRGLSEDALETLLRYSLTNGIKVDLQVE